MMLRPIAALLVGSALIAAPAHADDKADVEAFMHEYLRLWNAHDAAGISERFYRLENGSSWGTEEGLAAEFDRLKAQGYDRSDIKSVTGCVRTAETADVELRYVRLKSDGSFMPPKDRASIYSLRKFPDGWRVTGMRGVPADSKFDCPSGGTSTTAQ